MKKRMMVVFCLILAIIVAFVALCIYETHKTVYMHYDPENFGLEKISYLEYVTATEEGVLPNITVIKDKQMIKKIFDYLNSIPFVRAPKYKSSIANNNNGAIIMVYSEEEMNIGWIMLEDESYLIRYADNQTFKAKNKDVNLVSTLENLIFS